MTDFDKAFEKTLKLEGGYVFDPQDSGGETNMGITDRRDGSVDGRIDVDGDSKGDVPVKQLTKEQAKIIYKREYWDKLGFVGEPKAGFDRVRWKLFDIAVNQGLSQALKFAPQINGLDYSYALYTLCELQMRRYVAVTIARQQNLKFLSEWTRRAFDKGEDL